MHILYRKVVFCVCELARFATMDAAEVDRHHACNQLICGNTGLQHDYIRNKNFEDGKGQYLGCL